MRLLEAILEANQRYAAGDKSARLDAAAFADALPVAALTCIDARLNHLLPDALGMPEDKFIWLRNSGNIIFDPMSSMTRTLAMACAIKGGREIAIIGHTDCLVCKTTTMELLERFKALGVERHALPDNINEFFGMFSSERQNVLKSCDIVRHSPLIGPMVPVHGLMVDLESARLEWVVNGYQTLGAARSTEMKLEAKIGGKDVFEAHVKMPDFHFGEMKFPEMKIGGLSLQASTTSAPAEMTDQLGAEALPTAAVLPAATPEASSEPAVRVNVDLRRLINSALRYKIIGSDMKQYGPVTGAKLIEWLNDERIDGQTPIQVEGSSVWKPLAALAEFVRSHHAPAPPSEGFKPKNRPRR